MEHFYFRLSYYMPEINDTHKTEKVQYISIANKIY